MASEAARERSVTVAGLRLHVRERGDGDPVLLVNGIGAHIGMWSALERELPEPRLIAFDAPGTGRSSMPHVPLTMELLAGVAERLLDRLGYERVDVLGYSFGGLIAQFLARQAPTRVRRLILAATTPGWGGVPGSIWTLGQMSTPLRYYWRPYYESVVGGLMGGRARADRDFVRAHGDIRQMSPPNPFGYAWQLWAMLASAGTLAWLGQLTQPTLVLTGDDDPVMPVANAMLLARRIPNARLFIARNEGHLLLMDGRSRALPVIRSFLDSGDDHGDCSQETVIVSDEMLQAAIGAAGVPIGNPVAWMSAMARRLSLFSKPRA